MITFLAHFSINRPFGEHHPMSSLMIYGANGYTGSLIAREAARRGMRPILAGRNTEKLAALTVLERLPNGGIVRENGILKPVPAAWKTKVIDFGNGPVKAITIPWGDVATAYFSTGIPNIEFYMAAPLGTRTLARLSRYFGW